MKGPKDSKDSHTSVTMEALLYKPIDRVTRSTLVLHVSVSLLNVQGRVRRSVGDCAQGGQMLESRKTAC